MHRLNLQRGVLARQKNKKKVKFKFSRTDFPFVRIFLIFISLRYHKHIVNNFFLFFLITSSFSCFFKLRWSVEIVLKVWFNVNFFLKFLLAYIFLIFFMIRLFLKFYMKFLKFKKPKFCYFCFFCFDKNLNSLFFLFWMINFLMNCSWCCPFFWCSQLDF